MPKGNCSKWKSVIKNNFLSSDRADFFYAYSYDSYPLIPLKGEKKSYTCQYNVPNFQSLSSPTGFCISRLHKYTGALMLPGKVLSNGMCPIPDLIGQTVRFPCQSIDPSTIINSIVIRKRLRISSEYSIEKYFRGIRHFHRRAKARLKIFRELVANQK